MNLRVTTAILIAANLVPVAGILMLDWDVLFIMLLFWCENVIIGFFGIAKIVVSGSPRRFRVGLILPIFFTVHYGGFMAGHLMVLLALYAPKNEQLNESMDPLTMFSNLTGSAIWVPVAALLISHGWSFVTNFLGSAERENLTAQEAMALPYRRMVITHVALILGGVFLVRNGEPTGGLLLLIALKIGMDIVFHRKEHTALSASF